MAGDGDFAEMNSDTALLDMEISGLTADSRRVEPGFLFAALPGSQADGRDFIPEAVRRGAVAVLSSEPGPELGPDGTSPDVPILVSENPRRRLDLRPRWRAGRCRARPRRA